MTTLFNRDARLLIGDIEITSRDISSKDIISNQIRFSFKTNMHTAWAPNSCDIKIYNLSDSKRKSLAQGIVTDKEITIEAGYLNFRKTIFKGRSIQITHVRENVDWITSIRCIDGRAVDNRKKLNFSLGKNTKVIDVIEKISSEITSINTTNMIKKYKSRGSLREGFEDFKNGVVIKGKPIEELFNILNSAGWEASIQNSEIVIIEKDDTTGVIIDLNEDTGLVGGVEVGITGFVTAKSLLNGDIHPGRRVRLNTQLIENGEFKVNRALHTGDTFGNEWFTVVDLIPLGR